MQTKRTARHLLHRVPRVSASVLQNTDSWCTCRKQITTWLIAPCCVVQANINYNQIQNFLLKQKFVRCDQNFCLNIQNMKWYVWINSTCWLCVKDVYALCCRDIYEVRFFNSLHSVCPWSHAIVSVKHLHDTHILSILRQKVICAESGWSGPGLPVTWGLNPDKL